MEQKLLKLRADGWSVVIRDHPRYGWTCILLRDHMNYNTAPYGAGLTPSKAISMALLDAKNRNINLR